MGAVYHGGSTGDWVAVVAADQRMPALLTPTATQSLAVLTWGAAAAGVAGGGVRGGPHHEDVGEVPDKTTYAPLNSAGEPEL